MSILYTPDVSRAFSQIGKMAAEVQPGRSLHIARNSFNGGEISQDMAARGDQQRYQTGCHKLLNMVPMPTGGIAKRPGFKHIGGLYSDFGTKELRIIPFVFSQKESRIIVLWETKTTDGASLVKAKVMMPDGAECYQTPASFEVYKDEADKGGYNNAVYKKDGKPCLAFGWEAGILKDVMFCQSCDVLYYAHPKLKPGKIMRFADDDWRALKIQWIPDIKSPVINKLENDGSNGGATVNFEYAATRIDETSGLESPPSAPKAFKTTALNSSHGIIITLDAVENTKEYRFYKKKGGVFGFIGRTSDTVFTDFNIGADTEDCPPNYKNPFDGADNYPSIIFMHQQRLGFASSNSHPLTFWLSQTANFESMAASVPPKDDDSIEATLAAPEANRILWACSDRTGLCFGTEGGEWLLNGTGDSVLLPSNISFQPQTYYGSKAGMPVLRAGSSLLYIQRGAQAIREFGYSFNEDRYSSNDLSLLARHILADMDIVSWAWQAEPYGIVWCVLSDGTMAGLTYLREHDVIAWHRHKTNGKIKQVITLPEKDGTIAVLIAIDRDHDGHSWCLEKMRPFYNGGFIADDHFTDGLENEIYEARMIPTFTDVNLDNGTSLGLPRKIAAVKCRMASDTPFKIRIASQNFKNEPVYNVPDNPAMQGQYSGGAGFIDLACHFSGGFSVNPYPEFIFDGKGAIKLFGYVMSIEFAETAGNQK